MDHSNKMTDGQLGSQTYILGRNSDLGVIQITAEDLEVDKTANERRGPQIERTHRIAVQLLCHVGLFDTMDCSMPYFPLSSTIFQSLLRSMSSESVILSNNLILCRSLLLLLSVFPSTGVFSNEWTLFIRQSKYWSFNISPSNEYSRVDFLQD